jgi:ankyrin repeat protein
LLNVQANINEKHRGATSLYIACQNGHKEMVELLMRWGANIYEAREHDGKTPLFIALQKGHTEIAQLLFDAGANLVNEVHDGTTLLYLASQHGLAKIVKALIAAEINVNEVCDGVTPLYIASQNGHADVVKLLADAGANIDETNTADGVTSLCIAIQNSNTAVVKLLLDEGADANKAKTADGVTPLCIASQNNNEEVVRLLLEKGADVEQATDDGATPLGIAEQQGHDAVANVLRQEIQRLEDKRRAEAEEEKAAASGLSSPIRVPFRGFMAPPAFTPIVKARDVLESDVEGCSLDFQDTASTEESELIDEVLAEIQSEKHFGIAMCTCIACLAGITLIPLGIGLITNDDDNLPKKIIGYAAGLVGITLISSACLCFAQRKKETTAVGILPTDSYQGLGGEDDSISPINSDHSVVDVGEDVEEKGERIFEGLAAPKRREHKKARGAAAGETTRPLLWGIGDAPDSRATGQPEQDSHTLRLDIP